MNISNAKETGRAFEPNTGFCATASYQTNFGEKKLKEIELYTKEYTISLNEQECKDLLEAIQCNGWILKSFYNREEYHPYKFLSGSLDGKKAYYVSVYDEDGSVAHKL